MDGHRYDGCGYTSARLTSKDRVSFRYGLVAARIKIPRARGIWPAFWMLGQDFDVTGWPRCGELDISEYFGTGPAVIHGAAHGPGYTGGAGISGSRTVGSSLGHDFHVYSVAWEARRIRWYIDGRLYHTVTPGDLRGKRWVFDHDFFLLLNVAVGGVASQNPGRSVRAFSADHADRLRARLHTWRMRDLRAAPSGAICLRPCHGPRAGACTVARMSPISSMLKVTWSPAASHGYSSGECRLDSSRMQPPWQVPLPMIEPASTREFQEA